MRRVAGLGIVALAAEAAQLPLFGMAFGAPIVGLLAVRAALTVALFVFAVRGSVVLRHVLGALRLLAALIGIGMATLLFDRPGLAAALGGVCALDGAAGIALMMVRGAREQESA